MHDSDMPNTLLLYEILTAGQQFNTFLVTQVEVPSGRGRPPVVVDKDESLAKVVPRSSDIDSCMEEISLMLAVRGMVY